MNVGQLTKLLNRAVETTPVLADFPVVVNPKLGLVLYEQGEVMSITFQVDGNVPKLFLNVKEEHQHIPSPPPSYDHPH